MYTEWYKRKKLSQEAINRVFKEESVRSDAKKVMFADENRVLIQEKQTKNIKHKN